MTGCGDNSTTSTPNRFWSIAWRIGGAALLLAVALWIGRHADGEVHALESWVGRHGFWGVVVFVVAMCALTSLLIPDTLFAVAAGVLYGLPIGAAIAICGALITATINYVVARWLFRGWIQSRLLRHPKIQAVTTAAHKEGLRLHLLLRLCPINPVAISYALGASGAPYRTFAIGTLGMIPGVFVEVYFGFAMKHIAKASGESSSYTMVHTIVTIVGLCLCVAMMSYIARIARRALARAEVEN